MMKPHFEKGQRFGRLIILGVHHIHTTSGGKKKPKMLCRCDCGNDCVVSLYDMRTGCSQSCGCLAAENTSSRFTRHGASRKGDFTPEYRTWRNMLTRGRNPSIANAERYVLRGIGVCAEWLPGGDGNGFNRFLAHVGQKPSDRHSLDRINNDLGYEPGNVRWATQREQVNNQGRTVRIVIDGQELPLQEAATRVGIKASIILQRIKKLGWDDQRAISVPPRPDRRRTA